MVSGYAWDQKSQDFYQQQWQKYTKIFTQKDQKYALALGNHDHEANLKPEQIILLDQKNTQSYTFGEDYYIEIKNKQNITKTVLWVFNTHNKGCMGDLESYGCIEEILHLAFFHIPLPEFSQVIPQYGIKGDTVDCPTKNSGLFDMLRKSNFKAVFCGHDHSNDFGGFFHGVELVYARKTGFGCYGPQEGVLRGGRVININEEGQYKHYVSTF
ncbi:metallophosphoesterase, putative [Ichthyophthirius multifiliis]|uniref:Metallophosphoesterase, putative n=1 Tax=Ichthyophthirius multifiliis TaxID=5932 RepID=G0QWN3_ICHMU|nr:metallophosphoesterase, putative [Ichthyophthirius multifiliis]EGR30368.1 metallophosphoesterase, putative [Ichthyophthirius multifiliis]|eukprot:XP_004031955.1 metallophosphoesterase, putative [Ichthyophthirius multifiliis]